MINADYELLSVTTDDGEKYAFISKDKMFKFLKEMVREGYKNRNIEGAEFRIWKKPYIFRGITK